MKKVLFFSIKLSGLYGPRVVAVTTERGGRWWGRDLRDNLGTSGRISDIRGRFETEERAKAKLEEVDKVHRHFNAQRHQLENLRRELYFAEQQLTEQVIEGSPKRGADWLVFEVTRTVK